MFFSIFSLSFLPFISPLFFFFLNPLSFLIFLFLSFIVGIDIEAGCGQLTTELMKRRKREPTDAESNQKIINLLNSNDTTGLESGSVSEKDKDVLGDDNEVLDKSFISLDVEKERQLTFSEIENAQR